MVNTIKIGVFIPCFWPERNGIINYVDGLYSHINKIDDSIKTTIVTFDTANTKQYFKEENGFNVYRLPCIVLLGGTYVIPSISGIIQFIKLIRSENFDLINTHTRFFISSLLGLIWAKTKKVPLIHTEHGSSFVKDGSFTVKFIARIYDEILGRLVIKNAYLIIGVSNACLDFTNKLGGDNGVVVPNGINEEFWQTEERSPNKITRIGFCGRIVKGKGLQDLLKALSTLKQSQWELDIIGDGNYLNELKKLSKSLKIDSKIVRHGSQESSYIKDIYKRTDIFVNSSYTEGGPRTILEAGALRCAIISTSVGIAPEIIINGLNGLLINAGNVYQLSNALSILIDDISMQREFGNSISNSIRDDFSQKKIALKFHFLIQKVILEVNAN